MFPFPARELGFKALLSDEYIFAFIKNFCDAVVSRIKYFKRAKNRRYEDEDFLKVFFFSKMLGRSIYKTSEALNDYFLGNTKGGRKTFADERRWRFIPHQIEANKFLRKIGLKRVCKVLHKYLDSQLMEAFKRGLISRK
ncbi:MAG: hypothetical protein ACTSO4_16650 [Promethearchaeota archaeon]